ncbi:hypothetical protein CspHIS471_0503750 [Cutaneotrichosporon sp. HIS471]|nr:hypothetical protein CspHIS471_0503750 [Cutaneotrichosporon sp. HIS471]
MLSTLLFSLLGVVPVLGLDAATNHRLLNTGRPQVGLWQALRAQEKANSLYDGSDDQAAFSAPKHEAHCFDQSISHFGEVNGTFCQRYWLDDRYYKPGGPVFLLDGGETDGADRLPFLETGVLQILSNATGGLSIVLEHRYYGESVPVKSFSTDDLRFLNNADSLEDSANFIRNFKPPKHLGLYTDALKPKDTPWIYYGGSYAGARAAFMRKEYPDLVWGAIASSAVTHAQINMAEYFDPIQKYADQTCIATLQGAIRAIDALLELPHPVPTLLKGLFGVAGLENDDFGGVLQYPLGYWQARNWDPAVSSNGWEEFCDALTKGGKGGRIGLLKIAPAIMNYAKYIREHVVAQCPTDAVDCFGNHNDPKFLVDDLDQTWRLWLFQVCTQWGYFMPAPNEGPSILSKHVTLEYTSNICKQAYPPGKYFAVPNWPNITDVNARGDYELEAHRLAYIDGEADPWRTMTPQADIAPKRKSSVDKPLHLIEDGVHHWDENGLENHDLEPPKIRDVHEFEVLFVQEWLAQFRESKGVWNVGKE